MYSTDDDLFSARRTNKKWKRPTESTKRDANEQSVSFVDLKRMGETSDDSSDDLATERDPLWRRQRSKRNFARPLKMTNKEATVPKANEADGLSSEESDFECNRGDALLRRLKATKEKARREEKGRESCSSCSGSVCDRVVEQKRRNKLLERYVQRSAREASQEHCHRANFKPILSPAKRYSTEVEGLENKERLANDAIKKMEGKLW